MRRGAVAVVVAVALLGAPAPSAAEVASITATGWWTSVPVTSAPDDGVAVGRGAGGPTAVAAVRVTVAGDAPTAAVLRLAEADGVSTDTAAIAVCTTPNSWTPVAGGSMDDAPKPECGLGSVALERAGGGEWRADVAGLLGDGTTSLMLVPAEAASGDAAPPPFQVGFGPPAIDATAPAPSPTAGDAAPAAAGPEEAPPPPARAASPVTTTAPAPMATTATTVAGPAAEADLLVAPAQPVPIAPAGPDVGGDGRPWAQAAFFLFVAAAAGTAAGVARWQLRTRRAVG